MQVCSLYEHISESVYILDCNRVAC